MGCHPSHRQSDGKQRSQARQCSNWSVSRGFITVALLPQLAALSINIEAQCIQDTKARNVLLWLLAQTQDRYILLE